MRLRSLLPFRHHQNPLFPRDTVLISRKYTDHTLCSARSYSLHGVSPSQSASAKAPQKQCLGCPPASAKPSQKLCLLISGCFKATAKRSLMHKAQVLQDRAQVQREGCRAGDMSVAAEHQYPEKNTRQATESIFQHRTKPLVSSSIITVPKYPFFSLPPYSLCCSVPLPGSLLYELYACSLKREALG